MNNQMYALVNRTKGKMLAVASDATVDRVGESLPVDSWDLTNFVKNPVIPWAHNYSLPPIGIAKNMRVEDGMLVFEPEFNEETELARSVKKLYDMGHLNAFSVGFQPKQTNGGVRLELLEVSGVVVPANPNALMIERSLKSFEEAVQKDLAAVEDRSPDAMARVKAWVKRKLQEQAEEAAAAEEEPVVEKGVIPFADLGTMDMGAEWDGPAQMAECGDDLGKLKKICTWFDDANADVKSSYKLPHHMAEGMEANWKGVVAAMSALAGSRGGVEIPEGDVEGVYNHLAQHYQQFEQEPPALEDIRAMREGTVSDRAIAALEQKFFGVTPDAEVKEGRVLSKRSMELCVSARDALNALIEAATAERSAEDVEVPEPKVAANDPEGGSVEASSEIIAEKLAKKLPGALAAALRRRMPVR